MPEPEGTPPARSAAIVAQAILELVGTVPSTAEPPSATPKLRARAILTAASVRAAAVSGTLALPPGPLGVLTILPDLVTVWRIQAQMVADIAGTFGESASLTQEQLLYCLFRHAAAQVVRDLATRVGERLVFKQATLRALETMASRLGMSVSQRVIAKSVARWLPVAGALGVAGYAYYDTAKVGSTALELFLEENEGADTKSPV